MSKLTVIGNVPNTDLSWERWEYQVLLPDGQPVRSTEYLLVKREYGKRNRNHVVASLDMGQLVALRASIDAIVAAASQEANQ